MPSKKPFLRGTKWLGSIPVEAECTACPGVKFKAASEHHRPSSRDFTRSLEEQFAEHVKTAHSGEISASEKPGK